VSSTKRGGTRSEADNYPTPAWCVHRLLDHCPELREGGHWLEPAAGNGQIIRAVETYDPPPGITMKYPKWTAVELRKGEKQTLEQFPKSVIKKVVCPQDFFEYQTEATFDTIITNPPFWLAMAFIQKSLTLNTSRVIMLLRLNFVGTELRHEFFTNHMANRCLVLPNRPPFTRNKHGKWATDSIEYAWLLWEPPALNSVAKMEILGLTSKEDRKPGTP